LPYANVSVAVNQAVTFWQIRYFHITLASKREVLKGLIRPEILFLRKTAGKPIALIRDELSWLNNLTNALKRSLLQYRFKTKK